RRRGLPRRTEDHGFARLAASGHPAALPRDARAALDGDPLTRLALEAYRDQVARWPREGRHVLAQCTDDTIVVYQAYRPSITEHAVRHQRFGGGDFSFSRMSWVKPSFLWMMFRSGWATKVGQEVVLA